MSSILELDNTVGEIDKLINKIATSKGLYVTWCECCGYGMAVDNKNEKRCKWCRDNQPLKPKCDHYLPENRG